MDKPIIFTRNGIITIIGWRDHGSNVVNLRSDVPKQTHHE